ncbi:LamG-like jellyroll fold domain-containing protein [Kribbella sp. NPDC051620]|uniref:LamG-like jellyroll fold domain-containing protein n=1 Tax=Kribbella sp. NPDC051620 TaxID=3364120 RepID=UPI0037987B0D
MLRRNVLVGLAALGLVTALATPAMAASQRLRWRFDSASAVVTTVVDDSSHGHVGTVATSNGGQITTVTPGRDGIGQAVKFPAMCTTAPCPEAMITSPGSTATDLDPGTAVFSYGVWTKVSLSELSDTAGSNLFQKGLWNTSQWKVQIDPPHTGYPKGAPSCVVVEPGGVNAKVAYSTVTVADGNWHKITCQRTSTEIQIYVDTTKTGFKDLGSSAYVVNPAGQQVTLGAKSVGSNNDQYHGIMDDVFYNDYLAYP